MMNKINQFYDPAPELTIGLYFIMWAHNWLGFVAKQLETPFFP
jgi:hypothetical protein